MNNQRLMIELASKYMGKDIWESLLSDCLNKIEWMPNYCIVV